MNLPSIEQRMHDLLLRTAKETRPCRACQAQLYFVQHNNGKVAPYTADGVNHFINCPAANQFKKGKAS